MSTNRYTGLPQIPHEIKPEFLRLVVGLVPYEEPLFFRESRNTGYGHVSRIQKAVTSNLNLSITCN